MKPGMLTAALQLLFAPAAFAALRQNAPTGVTFQGTRTLGTTISFEEITRRETQHKRKRTRRTKTKR